MISLLWSHMSHVVLLEAHAVYRRSLELHMLSEHLAAIAADQGARGQHVSDTPGTETW